MKLAITTVVFFCFAMAANAQRSQPAYTYRQKQLADSLRFLFPGLFIQKDEDNGLPDVTMPVFTLPNKATFEGETAQGKIYTVKLDNMRILKPDETNVSMPNAIIGKMVIVPPLLTKP